MEFFQKSAEETLKKLKVDRNKGLSNNQIIQNQKLYGKNEFSPKEKISLFKKVIESLKEPMIFILLVAALITIGINVCRYFQGTHASFTESFGILIAIMLSVAIGIVMEGRSEKAFEALNDINEDAKVKVLRDGKIQYIHKKELTLGDIIKIEAGDKIPADCRLIYSMELKIDESMLTGESTSVGKNFKEIINNGKSQLQDKMNMVFAGTFVTYGRGEAVVTSIGDETEMGKIAANLKNIQDKSTPLQEKLEKLAKSITAIGIAAAALIFCYEIFEIYRFNEISFDSIQNAFMTSVALIVASVPEGLPTVVAMTLAINIIKMSKSNALVRKLIACETVGCVNVICSDKTGTLTKNQMTVIDFWSNGKLMNAKNLNDMFITENFILNSTADISIENGRVKFIGNPTECSMLRAFSDTICSINPEKCIHFGDDSFICRKKCEKYMNNGKKNISYRYIRNNSNTVYQYPFSSEKKSMTTIVSEDNSYRAYTKGSFEKIVFFSSKIIVEGKVKEFTKELKDEINRRVMSLESQGKRILAFSHKDMEADNKDWQSVQETVEKDMIFDGFVSIADPLREDVYEAVKKSRESGIGLKILTGDNNITAESIARQLDIVEGDSLILDASKIDNMSDGELLNILDKVVVIARSNPETKMRVVKLLKKQGNVVAVTGDGINDAPALRNADVGIAMGITGTEVSKEAADIVLLDDSFSTILKAVKWGRGIYENFQRFIQFQLTVNLVAVLTVFLCEILGFSAPFTTIQLLWVNLIMDGPPALSLGLESLRDYLMERKPIERNASIITKNMLFNIILNGLYIVFMIIMLVNNQILGGTEAQQTSIVFTTFVLFQLFNSFNARELGNESVFLNFKKNKPMVIIILITFLIQIVITQFGGEVFKTSPLSLDIWIKIIAYTFSVIVFSEIIRLTRRVFKIFIKGNEFKVAGENQK